MKTELKGCACRWDADDNRVATCVRHQGWLDVVQEWADRARDAEAKVVELVEKLDYATDVIDQRNAMLSRGRADFMQALTDPENQPSQWGTVTLQMYDALQAENERLRVNADRYQWLRDPAQDVSLVIDKRTGFVTPDEHVEGVGGHYTYEYRSGEDLDTAIDAARAALGKVK